MISRTPVRSFAPGTCSPTFHTRGGRYGATYHHAPRSTNAGKRWTWSGSSPHDTRMHHYAGLATSQKDAWTAVAAEMANDHSSAGVTTYNGPIAYMQTNLYRRLNGLPYTDDAPATGGDPGETTGQVQQDGTATGPVNLIHTP